MGTPGDQLSAIARDSSSPATQVPSVPEVAVSGRSLAQADGNALVSELESLVDLEQNRQANWMDWESMHELPRESKETLLQHAVATERSSLSMGRSDWKQKSKMLAVAGVCYVTGGAESPKYLERGADALVASADLARQNGMDDFAVISYERAVRVYDKLLEVIGAAPTELRARVTRKRAFIVEELKRPIAAPEPIASREVVG
jgi:hypothetical protein